MLDRTIQIVRVPRRRPTPVVVSDHSGTLTNGKMVQALTVSPLTIVVWRRGDSVAWVRGGEAPGEVHAYTFVNVTGVVVEAFERAGWV